MVFLIKLYCLIFLNFLIANVFASSDVASSPVGSSTPVVNVDFECDGVYCESIREIFMDVEGERHSLESLREKSRYLALDERIRMFDFEIRKDSDGFHVVYMLKMFERIRSIEIISDHNVRLVDLGRAVYRVGGVYNPASLSRFKEEIHNRLANKGMRGVSLDVDAQSESGEVTLIVSIAVSTILRVKEVRVDSDSEKTLQLYRRRVERFKGRVWDQISFRIEVDAIVSELNSSGFFDAQVRFEENVDDDSGKVFISVFFEFGTRYQFSFRGQRVFSRGELYEAISVDLLNSLGTFDPEVLRSYLVDYYTERGFYDTEINLRVVEGVTIHGLNYKSFFIDIKEGRKLKVEKLSFMGNFLYSDEQLKELFHDRGSVLSKRGYFDLAYKQEFPDILRRLYLEQGYVFAEVDSPAFTRLNGGVEVDFRIRERQKVVLEDVVFNNIPSELVSQLKSVMINQVDRPINIIELQNDFQRVRDMLLDKGYFFARITNLNDDSILQYKNNFQSVVINFEIDLGRKTYFDGHFVSGLDKTRKIVVDREVRLDRGEIVTPQKVERLRQRLNFLGLFSSVEINPFIINKDTDDDYYLVNLLIRVSEKDFGVIEVAPGYRTDIGVKLSTDVSYNNLFGMNRAVSLKTEVNQRLDFANLDSRRREEEKRMLEFLLRGNYSEPYLFNTRFQFDMGASYQRRRFFSFDADIRRFSPEISRSFGQHFSAGLRYQFETIRQYDATDDRDNDSFRIGSMTPTIGLDFRDNPINPKSGSYFTLTWEYASPVFGSLNEDDLKVHFHKLISRNNFYVPLSTNWTLATSLTLGYERNLADDQILDSSGNPVVDSNGNLVTRGFIPSIKVFRLDGIDSVRGFSDREINRLLDGNEIGEVTVQGEAYLVNFKFEPRYQMTDNFMIGGFFDAGRMFVDSLRPFDLRSSVGLTFKVVTPVGSLDFDYGVKTRRDESARFGRESFGRFHLSIGHF